MIARTLRTSALALALSLVACGGPKKEDMQPVVAPNGTETAATPTPPPPPTVTATATAAPITPPIDTPKPADTSKPMMPKPADTAKPTTPKKK